MSLSAVSDTVGRVGTGHHCHCFDVDLKRVSRTRYCSGFAVVGTHFEALYGERTAVVMEDGSRDSALSGR
jgi:hypothetical protein